MPEIPSIDDRSRLASEAAQDVHNMHASLVARQDQAALYEACRQTASAEDLLQTGEYTMTYGTIFNTLKTIDNRVTGKHYSAEARRRVFENPEVLSSVHDLIIFGNFILNAEPALLGIALYAQMNDINRKTLERHLSTLKISLSAFDGFAGQSQEALQNLFTSQYDVYFRSYRLRPLATVSEALRGGHSIVARSLRLGNLALRQEHFPQTSPLELQLMMKMHEVFDWIVFGSQPLAVPSSAS